MKRSTCPSCGTPYNGRRCRNCYYEHFADTSAQKSNPEKKSSGSGTKIRSRHPLVRFLILLYLIYSLMPMLRDWGLKLKAIEDSRTAIAAQPEPVLQPENMVILQQNGDITIFTTPEQFACPNADFCLYVYNESLMTVTVSAGDIRINDILLPHAALVCKARSGEIGKGWLEPEPKEWEAAGLRKIHTLSFRLTVLSQDGRVRFQTDEICLTTEGTAAF